MKNECKINPCPFCGLGFQRICEDRVNKYGKPYKVDYYLHISDECVLTQLDGSYHLPNDEGMIKRWNERKPVFDAIAQLSQEETEWTNKYVDTKQHGEIDSYADGYGDGIGYAMLVIGEKNGIDNVSVLSQDVVGVLSLDELEMLYLTEYDSESVEDSSGDEVLDFLNWCRGIEKRQV